jgi:RNA polymerase primary sigma factor
MDKTAAFDTYLRELSNCKVMKPDQERESAARIATLRHERWMAFLSQPRFASAVVLSVAEILFSGGAHAESKALLHAIAKVTHPNLSDAEVDAAERAYELAASAYAEVCAKADRDLIAADMVSADLDAIDRGQPQGARLVLDLPRGRDAGFRRYVQKVRAATQAFWRARSQFAKANLRLVVSMARRVGRGRMAMADLVQEGNIGLMQAIDRFDHTKGFRFSTYGAWWIRHAMNRALQNKAREIRLPVHVLDALQRVARARREWESKHGSPAPATELAKATGLSEAKIAKLERHYLVSEYPTSLDAPGSPDSDLERLETLVDHEEVLPEEAMVTDLRNGLLDKVMAELPAMERDILSMRFGLEDEEPQTLREIGTHYSLSRERIRQLQERALDRIRNELQRAELI